MCNNTQKKKAAGAGKDFTLFFGVMLHFNFKCVPDSPILFKSKQAKEELTARAWERDAARDLSIWQSVKFN